MRPLRVVLVWLATLIGVHACGYDNHRWTHTLQDAWHPEIAVDPLGNAYVAVRAALSTEMSLHKFSPEGDQLWSIILGDYAKVKQMRFTEAGLLGVVGEDAFAKDWFLEVRSEGVVASVWNSMGNIRQWAMDDQGLTVIAGGNDGPHRAVLISGGQLVALLSISGDTSHVAASSGRFLFSKRVAEGDTHVDTVYAVNELGATLWSLPIGTVSQGNHVQTLLGTTEGFFLLYQEASVLRAREVRHDGTIHQPAVPPKASVTHVSPMPSGEVLLNLWAQVVDGGAFRDIGFRLSPGGTGQLLDFLNGPAWGSGTNYALFFKDLEGNLVPDFTFLGLDSAALFWFRIPWEVQRTAAVLHRDHILGAVQIVRENSDEVFVFRQDILPSLTALGASASTAYSFAPVTFRGHLNGPAPNDGVRAYLRQGTGSDAKDMIFEGGATQSLPVVMHMPEVQTPTELEYRLHFSGYARNPLRKITVLPFPVRVTQVRVNKGAVFAGNPVLATILWTGNAAGRKLLLQTSLPCEYMIPALQEGQTQVTIPIVPKGVSASSKLLISAKFHPMQTAVSQPVAVTVTPAILVSVAYPSAIVKSATKFTATLQFNGYPGSGQKVQVAVSAPGLSAGQPSFSPVAHSKSTLRTTQGIVRKATDYTVTYTYRGKSIQKKVRVIP